MLVPAADAVTWGRGAGRAEASEFYSRRRVNGAWLTGRFAKAEVDAELARIGRVRRPVRKVARRVVRKPAPAVSARPAPIVQARAPAAMRPPVETPPPPPEAEPVIVVGAPPPPAPEPITADMPVPQAQMDEAVAVAPFPSQPAAVAEVAPAPSAIDPDADRMERLRLGLQRRGLAILAGRSEASSEPAPRSDGPFRQEKVEPAPPTP